MKNCNFLKIKWQFLSHKGKARFHGKKNENTDRVKVFKMIGFRYSYVNSNISRMVIAKLFDSKVS